MNSFSAFDRQQILRRLTGEEFDVLVIGGGITGAGIALDAAVRGLKVALIEMQDFAGGTSGRSTKLIHGGLRYLKQMELKLVAEVGKEREIIHCIAPHLTKPEHMLLPIVRGGSLGKLSARFGMYIYEKLAGVKKEELHRSLNVQETLETEPLLRTEGLLGGILFYEYRTDDARLTIDVMKEAVSRGACALNYLKLEKFIYENGKVSGANAVDQLTGENLTIKAAYVVNAAGPWVEEIDALDTKQTEFRLRITKGVHIVVDHSRLPVKQSLYFDTFDKRMLFVIPRDRKTYIGTTDTFYEGDKLHPAVKQEDKDYILKCANAYFPANQLSAEDIESCWAGLRPLIYRGGGSPSEISRKDEMFVFPSGLITIAGGKLTGYRKMAQRVTDLLAKKIKNDTGKELPACRTDKVLLSGGNTGDMDRFVQSRLQAGLAAGLSPEDAASIIRLYGSNCDRLFDIAKTLADASMPRALMARLIYAMEHESCVSPADFFIRRTGKLYFDIAAVKKWKDTVFAEMSSRLGWSSGLAERFRKEMEEAIAASGFNH